MPSVSYIYLRGLELEGRHPHDVGGWHVTIRRMEVGEGVPQLNFMVEIQLNEPFPPAPKLYPSQLTRFFYYRRIRNSGEVERHLRQVRPDVPVSLYLFASWANPPARAVIPMPADGEQPLPETHLVVLERCDPVNRAFHFRNTWGEEWGTDGYAALSYDYVDKYVFESWVTYHERQVKFEKDKWEIVEERKERRWVIRDEQDRRIYGFEVWDKAGKDRQGWSFTVETDAGLEVEELYVRPEFRGRGLGRILATKVREMADAKQSPLRVFVPFADCKQENKSNHFALIALARHLRVQFLQCPVTWAAYFATDTEAGSEIPVEPLNVPPRPKSTLEVVLAAALLSGPADVPVAAHPVIATTPSQGSTLDTESAKWDRVTRRRGELIYKKNRQGLSDQEQREFDGLERIVDEVMEQQFSVQTDWDTKIARVEAQLGGTEGGADQK